MLIRSPHVEKDPPIMHQELPSTAAEEASLPPSPEIPIEKKFTREEITWGDEDAHVVGGVVCHKITQEEQQYWFKNVPRLAWRMPGSPAKLKANPS